MAEQRFATPESAEALCLEGEVVEVSFFLPAWEMEGLTGAASRRGVSPGELMRLLLRRYLSSAGRELTGQKPPS
jgi:hypothetical protein